MYNQDYTKWASLNQNFTAPMFDAQRFMMPLSERLTHKHIAFTTESISSFVKYMQGMNKTNRSDNFVKSNLGYIEEQGERVLQYGQDVLEILKDTLKDGCEWSSEKVSSVFGEGEKPKTNKKGDISKESEAN